MASKKTKKVGQPFSAKENLKDKPGSRKVRQEIVENQGENHSRHTKSVQLQDSAKAHSKGYYREGTRVERQIVTSNPKMESNSSLVAHHLHGKQPHSGTQMQATGIANERGTNTTHFTESPIPHSSGHKKALESGVNRSSSESMNGGAKQKVVQTSRHGSLHVVKSGSGSEIQICVLHKDNFDSKVDVVVVNDVPKDRKKSRGKTMKEMGLTQFDDDLLVAKHLQLDIKKNRIIFDTIYSTVYECLLHTSRQMKKESILFDTIVKEVIGYPKEKSADAIIKGIVEFTCNKAHGSLKDIFILDSDPEMLDHLSNSMKSKTQNSSEQRNALVGGVNESSSESKTDISKQNIDSHPTSGSNEKSQNFVKCGSNPGIHIQVENEANFDSKADVVVVDKLPKDRKKSKEKQIKAMDIVQFDDDLLVAKGLKLEKLVKVLCDNVIKTTIYKCLHHTSRQMKKESILFKIVVKAIKDYPKEKIAIAMIDGIGLFTCERNLGSLRNIFIVDSDQEMLKHLSNELKSRHFKLTSSNADVGKAKVPIEGDNEVGNQNISSKTESINLKPSKRSTSTTSSRASSSNKSSTKKKDVEVSKPNTYSQNVNPKPSKHSTLMNSNKQSGSKRGSARKRLPEGIDIGSPPVQVCVKELSIIDTDADVVVVPRTPQLKGGMVAKIIQNKGGSKIKLACEQIMKLRNEEELKEGDIEVTTAGKLHFKSLFNAVSYSKHGPPGAKLIHAVKRIVINCLEEAEKWRFTSIAIPAISGGDAGHPKDDIAQGMVCGILQFCQGRGRHFLNKVILVDVNKEQVHQWNEYLKLFSSEGDNDNYEKESVGKSATKSMDGAKGLGQNGEDVSSWSSTDIDVAFGDHSQPKEDNRGSAKKGDDDDETCPICMDTFQEKPRTLAKCGHKFCKACIDQYFSQYKPVCPSCGEIYGVLRGTQPDGTMKDIVDERIHLPGYEKYGTIIIGYHFRSGIQTSSHPEPGKPYHGTSRQAYLPNNNEGKDVLELLKKAFDARLAFTIGTSVTTGQANTVTWNDIHHKTSTHGGPQNFGYPDPTYLTRVKEELAAKGITPK